VVDESAGGECSDRFACAGFLEEVSGPEQHPRWSDVGSAGDVVEGVGVDGDVLDAIRAGVLRTPACSTELSVPLTVQLMAILTEDARSVPTAERLAPDDFDADATHHVSVA
jgi:hypothetical protein